MESIELAHRNQLDDENSAQLGNVIGDLKKAIKDLERLPKTIGKDIKNLAGKIDRTPGDVLSELKSIDNGFNEFRKQIEGTGKSFESLSLDIFHDAENGLKELEKLRASESSLDLVGALRETRANLITAFDDLVKTPALIRQLDLEKLLDSNNPSVKMVNDQVAKIPELPFDSGIAKSFINGTSDALVLPVYIATLGNKDWHKKPAEVNSILTNLGTAMKSAELQSVSGRENAFKGTATAMFSAAFIVSVLANIGQQVLDAFPNWTVGGSLAGEGLTITVPKAATIGFFLYPIVAILYIIIDALNLIGEIVLIWEPGESDMSPLAASTAAGRLAQRKRRR